MSKRPSYRFAIYMMKMVFQFLKLRESLRVQVKVVMLQGPIFKDRGLILNWLCRAGATVIPDLRPMKKI